MMKTKTLVTGLLFYQSQTAFLPGLLINMQVLAFQAKKQKEVTSAPPVTWL
jgi:hypothetical protein